MDGNYHEHNDPSSPSRRTAAGDDHSSSRNTTNTATASSTSTNTRQVRTAQLGYRIFHNRPSQRLDRLQEREQRVEQEYGIAADRTSGRRKNYGDDVDSDVEQNANDEANNNGNFYQNVGDNKKHFSSSSRTDNSRSRTVSNALPSSPGMEYEEDFSALEARMLQELDEHLEEDDSETSAFLGYRKVVDKQKALDGYRKVVDKQKALDGYGFGHDRSSRGRTAGAPASSRNYNAAVAEQQNSVLSRKPRLDVQPSRGPDRDAEEPPNATFTYVTAASSSPLRQPASNSKPSGSRTTTPGGSTTSRANNAIKSPRSRASSTAAGRKKRESKLPVASPPGGTRRRTTINQKLKNALDVPGVGSPKNINDKLRPSRVKRCTCFGRKFGYSRTVCILLIAVCVALLLALSLGSWVVYDYVARSGGNNDVPPDVDDRDCAEKARDQWCVDLKNMTYKNIPSTDFFAQKLGDKTFDVAMNEVDAKNGKTLPNQAGWSCRKLVRSKSFLPGGERRILRNGPRRPADLEDWPRIKIARNAPLQEHMNRVVHEKCKKNDTASSTSAIGSSGTTPTSGGARRPASLEQLKGEALGEECCRGTQDRYCKTTVADAGKESGNEICQDLLVMRGTPGVTKDFFCQKIDGPPINDPQMPSCFLTDAQNREVNATVEHNCFSPGTGPLPKTTGLNFCLASP
ncbi:unnamed protein product [Amoebophrya sp. A120]|nr:unnamed protein product [Amoebophrya sp. A120]|eukprot:GSA120T00012406001.1